MAGVSLVAEAAEHLERTATDKEVEHDQRIAEQKSPDPMEKDLPPLPAFSQNHYVESVAHQSMKLKLQLFPIDDATRRALEMDKHNPHLELTLSTRKKISSVLEHLNRKWGNSTIASGELMLFPYNAQRDNLVEYQRWAQDSIVSAADLYTSIGSPSVFRLRYGWFSNVEFASTGFQASSAPSIVSDRNSMGMENERKRLKSASTSGLSTTDQSGNYLDVRKDQPSKVDTSHATAGKPAEASNGVSGYIATQPRSYFVKISDPAASVSWHENGSGDRMDMSHSDDADELRLNNGGALSAGEWADSLTNISVGDLLSEGPDDIIVSCDIFDAAIVAHMTRHQSKMVFPSAVTSYTSSIWDAEETCDAFSFQKDHAQHHNIPTSTDVISSVSGKQTNSMTFGAFVERLHGKEEPVDYPADEDLMDIQTKQVEDNSPNEFTELTDIYWPESLGPLDLDLPSSKYHSEEFILSDSHCGLSWLIASTLDAFQNYSSFGLDKKESAPGVEAQESSSFSDFKIGSEV